MFVTYKKIAFLVPRPNMSHEDFLNHWRLKHGPLVANSPNYGTWRNRYVQNHVQGDGPLGGSFLFAGVAEFWLPGSSPNEDEFSKSETYRLHIAHDEVNFINMSETVSMTAVEEIVLQGDAPIKLIILSKLQNKNEKINLSLHYRSEVIEKNLTRPKFSSYVRGWRVNYVLPGSFRSPGGKEVKGIEIDFVDEIWFDSIDEMALAFNNLSWGSSFLNLKTQQSFWVKEYVLFDQGNTML
jgi:hypothetical protein